MYDLIGDIHGHADELVELLDVLGYQSEGGVYQHASRTAVFVGDFIDRGPQIRETLRIVRSMYDSGAALAVMGNHEFNALAFHTPDPVNHGKFLREHSKKNIKQHAATLEQVTGQELQDYLEWFRQLPMWLELDGMRVVHACWDPEQISVIKAAHNGYGGVSTDFLHEASTSATPLFEAVTDALKGKEMDLPEGVPYFDNEGHQRTAVRVKWFRAPKEGETFASYALSGDDGLPTDRLPESAFASATPYPADAVPVFFGHYWLRATPPAQLASNVACLDFSVAKGGSLCAYRWDGERELNDDHFVAVAAHH